MGVFDSLIVDKPVTNKDNTKVFDNIIQTELSPEEKSYNELLTNSTKSFDPYDIATRESKVDVTEYSDYITNVFDTPFLDKERARRQDVGVLPALNLPLNVGLGVVEGFAYIPEIPDLFVGGDFSNAVTEKMKEWRNPFGESYREEPTETFDMDDPAWWAENGGGLAESVLEFFAIGGAVGMGFKALTRSAQVGKFANYLDLAGQGLTAATLAYTEGAMDAGQVYKEVYDYQKGLGKSDEEAKDKAGSSAAKLVAVNTGAVGLLNMYGVAPLFAKRLPSIAQQTNKQILAAIREGMVNRDGKKILEGLSNLSPIFKTPSLKKILAIEGGQEYVEENVNLVAQSIGQKEGGIPGKKDKSLGELIVNDVVSQQGLLSGISGFLGGIGQGAMMHKIPFYKDPTGKRENVGARENRLNIEYFNRVTGNIRDDINTILDASTELRNSVQEDGTINEEARVEAENKLFGVTSFRSITDGVEEALINTFRGVRDVSNTSNSAIKPLEDEISNITSQLQAPQLEESVKLDLTKKLQDLNKQLKAEKLTTDAIKAGLALDTNDNEYQTKATNRINEIELLSKEYKELSENFPFSDIERQAGVQDEIFNTYQTLFYEKKAYELNKKLYNVLEKEKEKAINALFNTEGISSAEKQALAKQLFDAVGEQYSTEEALKLLNNEVQDLDNILNNPAKSREIKHKYSIPESTSIEDSKNIIEELYSKQAKILNEKIVNQSKIINDIKSVSTEKLDKFEKAAIEAGTASEKANKLLSHLKLSEETINQMQSEYDKSKTTKGRKKYIEEFNKNIEAYKKAKKEIAAATERVAREAAAREEAKRKQNAVNATENIIANETSVKPVIPPVVVPPVTPVSPVVPSITPIVPPINPPVNNKGGRIYSINTSNITDKDAINNLNTALDDFDNLLNEIKSKTKSKTAFRKLLELTRNDLDILKKDILDKLSSKDINLNTELGQRTHGKLKNNLDVIDKQFEYLNIVEDRLKLKENKKADAKNFFEGLQESEDFQFLEDVETGKPIVSNKSFIEKEKEAALNLLDQILSLAEANNFKPNFENTIKYLSKKNLENTRIFYDRIKHLYTIAANEVKQIKLIEKDSKVKSIIIDLFEFEDLASIEKLDFDKLREKVIKEKVVNIGEIVLDNKELEKSGGINVTSTFEDTSTKLKTNNDTNDKYADGATLDKFEYLINEVKPGDEVTIKNDPSIADGNLNLGIYHNKDGKETRIGYFNLLPLKDRNFFYNPAAPKGEQSWVDYLLNNEEVFTPIKQFIGVIKDYHFDKQKNEKILPKPVIIALEKMVSFAKKQSLNNIRGNKNITWQSVANQLGNVFFYGKNIKENSWTINHQESILNWNNRLKRDYDSLVKIRKAFEDGATELKTTIAYKSNGSVIKAVDNNNNTIFRNLKDVFNSNSEIQLFTNPIDSTTIKLYNLENSKDSIIRPETISNPYSLNLYIAIKTAGVDEKGNQKIIPVPVRNARVVDNEKTSKFIKAKMRELLAYNILSKLALDGIISDSILKTTNSYLDTKIKNGENFNEKANEVFSTITSFIFHKNSANRITFKSNQTGITAETLYNDKIVTFTISPNKTTIPTINIKDGSGNRIIINASGTLVERMKDGVLTKTKAKEQLDYRTTIDKLIDGMQRNISFDERVDDTYHKFTTNKVTIGGTQYNSYKDFLLDTGGITTDLGYVGDINGNRIVSHVAGSNNSSIVITLNNPNLESTKQESRQEEYSPNLSSFEDSKFINELSDKYDFMFELADNLEINFDNNPTPLEKLIAKGGVQHTLAYYNPNNNTVGITQSLVNIYGKNKSKVEREIAHEIIHGVINNKLNEKNKVKLHSKLRDFISSLDKIVTNPNIPLEADFEANEINIIKNILKLLSKDNKVEEVVTYAFTNPTFAKFLLLSESDFKPTNKIESSLWAKLRDIIIETFANLFTDSNKLNELVDILDNSITLTSKGEPVVIPKITEIGKKIEPDKTGIDFVFEENSELNKIGSKEQYSKYLSTIFPDSKVKNIVYHGTKSKSKIEKFDDNQIGALDSGYFGRGFYLTPDRKYASNYIGDSGHVESVLINLQNPLETDMNQANTNISLENNDGVIVRYGEDLLNLNEVEQDPNEIGEIVIPKTEQIHVLGSKEDIEGFKKYLGLDKKTTTNSFRKRKGNKTIDLSQDVDYEDDINFEKDKLNKSVKIYSKNNILLNNLYYQNNTNQPIEEYVASEKTIRDLAARMADRIGLKVEYESDRTKQYKGKLENNIAHINLANATLDTPVHEILGHPIIRAIKLSKKDFILETQDNSNLINELEFIAKEEGWTKEKYNQEYEKLKTKKTGNSQLYQNLLKELEVDKGKEVLDRIKKDYFIKGEIVKGLTLDEQKEIRIKLRENKTITYNGIEYGSTSKGDIRKIYSLEEQQEEAIVELLGLMTAERLDAVKDGKLISLLKRLLKEIKGFIKSLLKQREVEIDKLPDNMTLGDIADLLAYSNSKLILPGNEVVYTTPDNKTFKTYNEASNHISKLAKRNENINVESLTLKTIPDTIQLDEYTSIIYDRKSNMYVQYSEYGEYNKDVDRIDISIEEAIELYKDSLTYQYKVLQQEVFDEAKVGGWDLFDRGYSGTDIEAFIEKNKEYEQSKEIIDEWKKVNNIQYNPEEVYSRGQGFYSVVGAYSKFDVNLMFQNLLVHLEDHKKVGGEFTISAFTKPIDKKIPHLEGSGGKIKFKIFPQPNDIKWAANTDVYSGSVWDASEKVNKDKKSEILGVSYTKTPSLQHTNSNDVKPNLAEIIDNLAHHHNELGIQLTGNNFRLEYDEDIPYQTKKIINSINSILDQKYGKLIKPEISVSDKKEITFNVVEFDPGSGEPSIIYNAPSKENADNFIKEQISKFGLSGNYYKIEEKIIQQGKQPTQTNETLKESIESIKSKVNTNYSLRKNGDFWVVINNDNGKIIISTEDKIKAEKKYNELSNGKKYTSQALINTKLATLKEVAKKYQRSLIRSEVKQYSRKLFETDELPFQKISYNKLSKQKFDKLTKEEQEIIEWQSKNCK